VLETPVNFSKTAQNGADSGVDVEWLTYNNEITFGKTYTLTMDVYVPATFMNKGRIWINPSLDLWTGEDLETFAGTVLSEDGFDYNKNSDGVTKVGDFYKVHAAMTLDTVYGDDGAIDFPEGSGQIIAFAFVSGFEADCKGSIFFDNVSIDVDGTTVASEDYEKGVPCEDTTYRVNRGDRIAAKAVTFTGNTLTVSKTSLTIKKGKKATIKTTTMPSAKATFKSSNKKIATVTAKGVVKGIKKGKATITVKANGKTAKVKVTVK
jgi:hypothetical protein